MALTLFPFRFVLFCFAVAGGVRANSQAVRLNISYGACSWLFPKPLVFSSWALPQAISLTSMASVTTCLLPSV